MQNKTGNISPAVVNRLPRYYRYLEELLRADITKISSKELSALMNVTASQIRQDFNCFGEFGHQGYGYNVRRLHEELGRIIGVERKFTAAIVGTGNLGRTIAKSGMFARRGLVLRALFDIDPALVGQEIAGLEVLGAELMADYCRDNNIDIAVLTLPKEATLQAANILAAAGVRGFWNFSNTEIKLGGVVAENMHMGDSLMTLCYSLNNSQRS